jgi:hypothetical protein
MKINFKKQISWFAILVFTFSSMPVSSLKASEETHIAVAPSPQPEISYEEAKESQLSNDYDYNEDDDRPLSLPTSEPAPAAAKVISIKSDTPSSIPTAYSLTADQTKTYQNVVSSVQTAAAASPYGNIVQEWFAQHQTMESQIAGYYNLTQAQKDWVSHYICTLPVFPPIIDPPYDPSHPEEPVIDPPYDPEHPEEPVIDPPYDPEHPKEPVVDPPYDPNPEVDCKKNPADARCSWNPNDPVVDPPYNPYDPQEPIIDPPYYPNDPTYPGEPNGPIIDPPYYPNDPTYPGEPNGPIIDPPYYPNDPTYSGDPNDPIIDPPYYPNDPTYPGNSNDPVIDPPYYPNDPTYPGDPNDPVIDPPYYDPNPNNPQEPIIDPPYNPNYNDDSNDPIIDPPYNPNSDDDTDDTKDPIVDPPYNPNEPEDPKEPENPEDPSKPAQQTVTIYSSNGFANATIMYGRVTSVSVVLNAQILNLPAGAVVKASIGLASATSPAVQVPMTCNASGVCQGTISNPAQFYPYSNYVYSIMVYSGSTLLASVTNQPLQVIMRDMTPQPESTGSGTDTNTNPDPNTDPSPEPSTEPSPNPSPNPNPQTFSFPALPKTSWKERSFTVGSTDATYVDVQIKSENGTNNLLEMTLTDPDTNAKRVYSYNLNNPDVIQAVYFATTGNPMSTEYIRKSEHPLNFADVLSRIIKHLEIPTHAPSKVTGQNFTIDSKGILKEIAEILKPHIRAEVKTLVYIGNRAIEYDSADPKKITTYTIQKDQWGRPIESTKTNVQVYDSTGTAKTLFENAARDLIQELNRLAGEADAEWQKKQYTATAEAVEVNALRIYPYTNWYEVPNPSSFAMRDVNFTFPAPYEVNISALVESTKAVTSAEIVFSAGPTKTLAVSGSGPVYTLTGSATELAGNREYYYTIRCIVDGQVQIYTGSIHTPNWPPRPANDPTWS